MRVGPHGAHSSHSGLLIGRVGVCVDEEHAHGFAPCIKQSLRLGFHLINVYWRVDLTISQHALVDFQSQCTWHDGCEAATQAPSLRAIAPTHFQHIAKAARGNDARACHLAF